MSNTATACPSGDGAQPCDTIAGDDVELPLTSGETLKRGDRIGGRVVLSVRRCARCQGVVVFVAPERLLEPQVVLKDWPNVRFG